jgi:small Trp-rich protein
MWFLIAGVLLLLMKTAEFGPVADWSWIVVLAPFALAAAWWSFSDTIGLPQKRAMQRMEDRKAERRAKSLEALGIDAKRDRHVRRARDNARRVAADTPAPPVAPPVKLVIDERPSSEPRI